MLDLEGTFMVIFSKLLLLLRQKRRSRTVTRPIARDLVYHLDSSQEIFAPLFSGQIFNPLWLQEGEFEV